MRFVSYLLVCLMILQIYSLGVNVEPLIQGEEISEAGPKNCGGPPDVHSIQISPPGPVTIPADASRVFNATLKDSNGLPIGGSPTWGTSDGSVVAGSGSEATYYPSSVGTHSVWACTGSVNQSVEVRITLGTTTRLELSGNKVNMTSDEVLEIHVHEFDVRGNSGELFVPSSQWVIPDGSSLQVNPGGPAIWTPGSTGNQTISVSAQGFTADWQVNVSRGQAHSLVISTDRETITADEVLSLSLELSDLAGNTWPVNGTWSTLSPNASAWLSASGSSGTFEGHRVGAWTIRAEYSGSDTGNLTLTDDLTLTVVHGSIAQVTLEGHGTTVLTGDIVELDPRAFDVDGNEIDTAMYNWSVQAPSGSVQVDAFNHTFQPKTVGQHTIQVESGGVPTSIRIQVEWSDPIDLNVTDVDGDWYLTVVTGESLDLRVMGLDKMGEWHTYDPIWQVEESFGSIQPTGGSGEFEYHASGVNWTQLHAFVGDVEYTILVYVTPGQLDYFTVDIPASGVQGESVIMNVRGFDISGNGVSFPMCDVQVTSTAGKGSCEDEVWTLALENAGEQQLVTVRYEGASGSDFIDVTPTLLGGNFGSSTQVVMMGAGFIAVLIAIVLVIALLQVKKNAREIEDSEESEEIEESPTPLDGVYAHQAPMPTPVPASEPAPTPSLQMTQPPAPSFAQTPPNISPSSRRPNTPPPPAFMFAPDINPNSSAASPISPPPPVNVGEYGYGDPSKGGGHEYGWEGTGTSAPTRTSEQPTTNLERPDIQPGTQEPQSEAAPNVSEELDSEEPPSDLASALSNLGSTSIEIEETAEPPAREDFEEPAPLVEEIEPTSYEPSQSDDWGDGGWDADWGGSDTTQEEPGDGPVAESGVKLKPLPGTKAGEGGWYFDEEGKPSLWEFGEQGWALSQDQE